MKSSGDSQWILPVDLKAGRHEFKFVVDGKWVHDPQQATDVNDVGSHNNVVDVDEAGEDQTFETHNRKRH
jgi:5'-AMP-activated protein kinase regulatory beta subunit